MNKSNSRVKSRNPITLLLLGSALTTLYFNSKIQDPFNSPKMWILFTLASLTFGYLVLDRKSFKFNKTLILFVVLAILFVIFNFISALNTDEFYTAIFGVNQRRTGFLTYLSLVVISVVTSIYFRYLDVRKLQNTAFLVLLILVVYGQFQINGKDFIAWNNTYNAIITTLGNPNFAAAIMAILSVLVLGLALQKENHFLFRIFSGILVLAAIWTIYLSNARQGLLSFFVGFWILIIIKTRQFSKKISYLVFSFGTALGFLSILGMLQKGPLTNYLYKGSVTVRGYYWDAGIQMFKNNWLFGIGLDRYGEYFKQYRDVGYPLNYGYEITSTNAHNVPIQLFATGGIFVGLTYLLILFFTFLVGMRSTKNAIGSRRILVGSVFAAWLSFQAQSIVSIDNIGISVWGWILTGAVYGLSNDVNEINNNTLKINNKTQMLVFKQQFVSGLCLILSLLLIIPLYRSESNMFKARASFNPQDPKLAPVLRDFSDKVYNSDFSDPFYKLVTSTYLIDTGYIEIGLSRLNELNRRDPRNLDVLLYLAVANKNLNKIEKAIFYRKEIKTLDPFNARNLLELGLLYKSFGDVESSLKMLSEIKSFAADDLIYVEAQEKLS